MVANDRTRLRRISRLEVLADRRFREKQLENAEFQEYLGDVDRYYRGGCLVAITNLCIIILYGLPRMDEPLVEAWNRSLAKLLREFPLFAENGTATPFRADSAKLVARDFRKYVLPSLPGTDDNEKICKALARGPKWLLWHTHADQNARPCGLKVPEIPGMQRFARGPWFITTLPEGPFELRAPRKDKARAAADVPPSQDFLTQHAYLRAVRVRYIRNQLLEVFQKRLAEGKEVRPKGCFPFPNPFEVLYHKDSHG